MRHRNVVSNAPVGPVPKLPPTFGEASTEESREGISYQPFGDIWTEIFDMTFLEAVKEYKFINIRF